MGKLNVFNISYIVLIVAFCFFMQRILFLKTPKEAKGIVTSISTHKKRGTTDTTIEFMTVSAEKTLLFTTDFGKTSSFFLDDSVKVYYQPTYRENAIVNDFMHLWSLTLYTAGSGVVIWLIGLLHIFFMKR